MSSFSPPPSLAGASGGEVSKFIFDNAGARFFFRRKKKNSYKESKTRSISPVGISREEIENRLATFIRVYDDRFHRIDH